MQDGNESRLIERAKACDEEALSELYHRHANAVFRYIYYRVGDQEAAEDLVGDVFVRAMEGLPSYQQTGIPFEAWLYRIAQARVVDHYRRQNVRRTVALDEQLPDGEETTPDRVAAKSDEIRQAREAMSRLTDEQQMVLSLRFIAGHPTAEVATLLGKTEGAVKALQSRALASLRRLLEAEP